MCEMCLYNDVFLPSQVEWNDVSVEDLGVYHLFLFFLLSPLFPFCCLLGKEPN